MNFNFWVGLVSIPSPPVKTERHDIASAPSFSDFWKQYPARKGRKLGKQKALQYWNNLPDEEKQTCFAATMRYKAYCLKIDRPPQDAFRYLRDRIWAEFVDPEVGPEECPQNIEYAQTAYMERIRGKLERDQRLKLGRYNEPRASTSRHSIEDRRNSSS